MKPRNASRFALLDIPDKVAAVVLPRPPVVKLEAKKDRRAKLAKLHKRAAEWERKAKRAKLAVAKLRNWQRKAKRAQAELARVRQSIRYHEGKG